MPHKAWESLLVRRRPQRDANPRLGCISSSLARSLTARGCPRGQPPRLYRWPGHERVWRRPLLGLAVAARTSFEARIVCVDAARGSVVRRVTEGGSLLVRSAKWGRRRRGVALSCSPRGRPSQGSRALRAPRVPRAPRVRVLART